MRERVTKVAAALDALCAAAGSAGDAHYLAAATRLRHVLARVGEAATQYLKVQLRQLLAAGAVDGGSSGGRPAPERLAPPAPITDLLADYRRVALEFDCYRDATLFTRPPAPGEPSSAGGRFFSGGGGGDPGGETTTASSTSSSGPAGPGQRRGFVGGQGPDRAQLMLGNASHLFRSQRLPLLQPRRSPLAAFLAEQRRRRERQDSSNNGNDDDRSGGLPEAEVPLPSVSDLAEVSLSGRDMPPLPVLRARAWQVEGELLHGRLRHVLAEQLAASRLAGEPEVAVASRQWVGRPREGGWGARQGWRDEEEGEEEQEGEEDGRAEGRGAAADGGGRRPGRRRKGADGAEGWDESFI
jgi:hypothetical protein